MESEKTFVLVHQAFYGGWCWREVGKVLSPIPDTMAAQPDNIHYQEAS